jgi:N-acetylmuramoyl-L-alanine amidase
MMTFDRPRTLITATIARFAFAAMFLVCLAAPALPARSSSTAVRRQSAQAQFARAHELSAALHAKPLSDRTLDDYKQAVSAYRRVYLITPNATEVPDALMSVAQLFEEMGKTFGGKYAQSAVDTYQFLIHEYPGSRYCPEALLRVAGLQKDELNQPALAAKSYEEYLHSYPHSARRREVQEQLAELALLKTAAAPAPVSVTETKVIMDGGQSQGNEDRAHPSAFPRVRRITASATEGSTRIVIELDRMVSYQSAKISNPDRIYFDLNKARLSPGLAGRGFAVKDVFLKGVRVAQNQIGVVRVVFEVAGVKDYTASLLDNPARLVVDLHGLFRADDTVPAQKSTPNLEATGATTSSNPSAASSGDPRRPRKPSPDAAVVSTRDSSTAEAAAHNPLAVKSKPAHASLSEPVGPSPVPKPTRDGQQSLTRALGLKIGRIVIDPGHGGHDTGTIGPSGFMEKDLCLDVALRLGRIIEQRLPGAEVIYTRQDDTFVPLEERTAIANQAKADLFLSIHANSSDDHAARGVETYYLNIKGTPDAMAVAARENAVAQNTIHDLQDLIAKITQNEKLGESREFASDIQDSLSQRIQKTSRGVKNRGVRKAPFVVLIGANMPSVLSEISFLSNPSDEQLLKKPETRQRIAEGLYQGVVRYLQSLNSLTYNLPHRDSAGHGESSPAIAQSGNQR